jgi:hypothetical protein
MANHLENMARRLEGDPFFVACPLALYAKCEGLSEDGLAAALKCSKEALVSVRLCRAPVADEETFPDDVERIAVRFSVDANVLTDAIRRGQAIFHMTRGAKASATLLAARDAETPPSVDHKKGDCP